jgi:hypothetical protein
MATTFFQLSSPRDMLDKAKREADRMKTDLHIDNIFNFFVTAYHVKDYVKTNNPALGADLDKLLHHEYFKMCRFLCNKGKHLVLSDKSIEHIDAVVIRKPGATFGSFAFNSTAFNAGPMTIFTVDGKSVDIHGLSDRLIQAWEGFFDDHGIA